MVALVEKRDRTPGHGGRDTEHGVPAALSSHAKGRPFSMWLHVAGVVWSRAERQ